MPFSSESSKHTPLDLSENALTVLRRRYLVKDEAGRFIAKNASASGLADCSDASLLGSASGAFVDLD